MFVDIIIPCFNEDKNITQLVNSWLEIIERNLNFNVYFINNGSTDNTKQEIINNISLSNNKRLHVIDVPINKGYGFGLKQGISITNSDVLCWTHADLQIPAVDVEKIIQIYLQNTNSTKVIYKGKRKKRNFLDATFTKAMSVFGFILTGMYIKDINAQPKIFPRQLLDEIDNFPDDFSIDAHLLFLAKLKNYQINEVRSNFYNRINNEAKGGGSFKGKIKLSVATLKYLSNQSFKGK